MGYVPAILDGDMVLADSFAILLVCSFYHSSILQNYSGNYNHLFMPLFNSHVLDSHMIQ